MRRAEQRAAKRVRSAALRGLAAALPIVAAVAGPASAAAPPRAVIVSWDGAGDEVVDRLLAEGHMPALAALAARGTAAGWVRPAMPSKTAAAHAALWTGTWSAGNGITGNEVPLLPRSEHTLFEHQSGFDSRAETAEPIFVTAALAGRRVVSLSTTQSIPAEPWMARLRAHGVPADRLTVLGGFEDRVATAEVIGAAAFGPPGRGWTGVPGAKKGREASVKVGDDTIFLLLYDEPSDPIRGYDRLLIRLGSRDGGAAAASSILAAHPARAEAGEPGGVAGDSGWSAAMRVHAGERWAGTFFRLFDLAPDGSRVVLYRRAAYSLSGAISASDLAAYEAAYPGFEDSGFWVYQTGALGKPLAEGGDGEAERRVLEIAALNTRLLIAGTRFALATWKPDILFHYTLLADDASHAWAGMLDPRVPGHDPVLAGKLWLSYARVFEVLDGWIAAIVAAAPADTVVALVSDHGHAGTRRHVYVNRILEQAGLLAWGADGRPDLARTAIVAPWVDFQLRVNGTDRRGGIVPPEKRGELLERATAALLAARDPDTGAALVRMVARTDDVPGYGLVAPLAGELVFDLAPGYYLRTGKSPVVAGAMDRAGGGGEHGFWPERREMQAIFYAAGPGLRPGSRLGEVRAIDVVPTLAYALGLPAPAQATGRVLGEALAP